MKIIETKNLTKSYGKSRGINELKLSVEEGDFFGFIGPNGAGKSTTIRTLLGLISPTSGSATVLGHDIVTGKGEILKEGFFDRHRTGTLTLMTPPDSKNGSGGKTAGEEIPFTVFAVLETDANISELFDPLGSERALVYAAAHAKYFSDPKTTHILALTTCVDAVHTTRTVVLCALEGEME